jgi:hypothetical protein
MAREKIELTDNLVNFAAKMSEGNPGAIAVLSKLLTDPANFTFLLHMDDMNIRGCQIWVAYKDWAGGDIEKLKKGLSERDVELVKCVNENSGIEEIAVVSGASRDRDEDVSTGGWFGD